MADVSAEVRAERFALATGFILRAVADRARVLGRRGRRGRPQLEHERVRRKSRGDGCGRDVGAVPNL